MRYYTLFFAALLLVSCLSTPAPAAVPTSTPVWLPTQIPASGLIYLPLEPAGTPEANPIMVIEAAITDAVTKRPVAADIYIIHDEQEREPTPDELVAHATEHCEIKLLSQLDGWFVVRAPGYADWKIRLHYRLKTSRKLSGPIQLQRLPGDGTTI